MISATDSQTTTTVVKVVEPIYLYTFLLLMTVSAIISLFYIANIHRKIESYQPEVVEIVECDSVISHATEDRTINNYKKGVVR